MPRLSRSARERWPILSQVSQVSLFEPIDLKENPDFLDKQLITYLGNKRGLLPFIGKGLEIVKQELGKSSLTFLDLFSGTGVVARYAKQFASHVIANDLETYSRITNECYLTNRSEVDFRELAAASRWLDDRITETWQEGFITEMYAPKDESCITCDDRVFYTRRNATFIDTARCAIDEMEPRLQRFFLAPLLAKASVHANTSGVFKGFYKTSDGIGQYGGNAKNALTRILGKIDVPTPVLSNFETTSEVHQQDANVLVEQIGEVDVAYLDPPYNQHPYGSNYFMLNLICSYEPPTEISRVSGIPTDWNRSSYNKRRRAENALFGAVERCKAKFILVSYNSEGFIAHETFLKRLGEYGTVSVLETPYNTFRGSRNLRDRTIHVTEFLYLLRK